MDRSGLYDDKTLSDHPVQQAGHIASKRRLVDFVIIEKCSKEPIDAAVLCNPRPDPGSHIVQAEVFVLVKNNDLAFDVLKQRFRGDLEAGLKDFRHDGTLSKMGQQFTAEVVHKRS